MAHFYQGVGVVTLSTQVCLHIDLSVTGTKGPLNKKLRQGVVVDSGHPAQRRSQGIVSILLLELH
jgi:hypothetical protein